MPTILPRTSAASNAGPRASVIALFCYWLCACAFAPSIPASVVLDWVRNSNGNVVAFNAASDTLASGGSDGWLRLWRLPDGAGIANWKAHSDSVHGLIFLAETQALLSASYDGSLAKWRLAGALVARTQTDAPITDMIADERSDLIVTGHNNGMVRIWRLSDLSKISEQRRHDGAVRAVAFHPDTRQFASSGRDGRVQIWRGTENPRALAPPPSDAHDLAFSPDGRYLTGSGWFKVFRWHLAEATLQIIPTEHFGLIASIDYGSDGQLATISRQTDSAVLVLDAASGQVKQRFQPHDLCGAFVRFSPNGRYLATTSDDASVRIWDLDNPLPKRKSYPERMGNIP